jgi:hypothetical protein
VDRESLLGTVDLRTRYPVESGIATVNLTADIAEEIYVAVTSRIERRFPDRVDAFAAVVRTVD